MTRICHKHIVQNQPLDQATFTIFMNGHYILDLGLCIATLLFVLESTVKLLLLLTNIMLYYESIFSHFSSKITSRGNDFCR